jgi:hypothetical protein
MTLRRAAGAIGQQSIDPKRKEGVRIAEQFLEKTDGLIMKGLRRELAAAEARVLAGDAGAAGDAEFLFLSIRHRLRDRDAIRREVMEICARAARARFLERMTARGHGSRSGERGGAALAFEASWHDVPHK